MIQKAPRTKLEAILQEKGLSQVKFLEKYNKMHPTTKMVKGHLSDIVSGKKKGLMLETVYRICRTLKKSPNQILDYEEHISRKPTNSKGLE